jgi:hypothetical protein
MKFYLNQTGNYYRGDKADPRDTEVPERPSIMHTWDGEQWVDDSSAYELEHYAELRREAYPPTSDYMDGMVKGNQAQINAYISACQAVKARYPKP